MYFQDLNENFIGILNQILFSFPLKTYWLYVFLWVVFPVFLTDNFYNKDIHSDGQSEEDEGFFF